MALSDDNRIIDLLTDLLYEMRDVKAEIKGIKEELVSLNKRVENLEHQQAQTNLGISELRLSVMRLAEEAVTIRDHEDRLHKLEAEVFGKKNS
jgi:predicted  nucleic acid-binding Zn-ribbon protein